MKNIEIETYGCPISTLDADVADARSGLRHTWPSDPTVALVLSLLSDAQELVAICATRTTPDTGPGTQYAEDARHLINRAKYIADTYLTGS